MIAAIRFLALAVCFAFLSDGVAAQSADRLSLLDAVDASLEYYPTIQSARAAIAVAQASLMQARAARLPVLNVTGSAVRFQEQMIVAPLHSFDLTRPPQFDRTLIQSEWSAGYTLFDGGNRTANIAVRAAQIGASETGRLAVEQKLILRVAETYLGILSALEVDTAAGRRIASLEAEVSRVQQLFDVGRAASVNVLRARAALATARAERVTTASRVSSFSNELGRLIGRPIARGSLVRTTLREDPYPAGQAPSPGSSPAEISAVRQLEGSQARLRAARATRLPSIALQSSVVTFGSRSGNFSGEWRGGVGISFPIFTGGARSGVIAESEANLWKAREDLRLIQLETQTALEQAMIAVREIDARTLAIEEAVVHQEEVARIELLALDAGAGVQTDYLRAEADLFSVRATLIQLRHGSMLARVAAAAVAGDLSAQWLDRYLESSE